jgi:nucleotidyltransferase substrate binding protein (TIGR01987 family)
MLDLSSFKKAVQHYNELLNTAYDSSQITHLPKIIQEAIKEAVIQNFEVTYELSWKMMKRWLERNFGNEYVDGVNRRELFRLASESLLISDVDKWMVYHKARNETSHTYDAITAEEVFVLAT